MQTRKGLHITYPPGYILAGKATELYTTGTCAKEAIEITHPDPHFDPHLRGCPLWDGQVVRKLFGTSRKVRLDLFITSILLLPQRISYNIFEGHGAPLFPRRLPSCIA
jgi:hypothetical protein